MTDVTSKKGRASVLALDAFEADKLLTLDGARLIAVWVALNTVDQLKDRYRSGRQAGGHSLSFRTGRSS